MPKYKYKIMQDIHEYREYEVKAKDYDEALDMVLEGRKPTYTEIIKEDFDVECPEGCPEDDEDTDDKDEEGTNA